jgi:hypothetical protein
MVGRLYELDAEPSAEDSAILQSLMNAGHADRQIARPGGLHS